MNVGNLSTFEIELEQGRVLVVQAAADLEIQARSLLNTCASLDAKGPRLRDGSTIQFGSSRLTIRQRGPAPVLHVHEPDYLDDPASKTVAHVDRTLRVLLEQCAMLELTGETPGEVSLAQTFVCERGALRDREIYFERLEPTSPIDSGWFAGRASAEARAARTEWKAEELVALPLHELFLEFPAALKLLGLPVGYLAVFRWDQLVGLQRPDGSEVALPPANAGT